MVTPVPAARVTAPAPMRRILTLNPIPYKGRVIVWAELELQIIVLPKSACFTV
jgi:hypothetical protein